MNARGSVNDEMLNAYLDGELEVSEATVVEEALSADPALNARLQKLVAVSKLSQRVVDNLAHEAKPKRMREKRLPNNWGEPRQRGIWRIFNPAVAAIVSLAIGIVVGVNVFNTKLPQSESSANPSWHQQAAYFHQSAAARYRAQQPMEVNYSDPAEINRYLQETLEKPPKARDLSEIGLRIMGGRMLHSNEHPYPQLYYLDPNDTLVSLALYPESGPTQAPRWNHAHSVPILGWRQNDTAHSLIGDLEPQDLEKISSFMRASLSTSEYDDLLSSH